MPAKTAQLMAMGMPAQLAQLLGHVEYAGDPTSSLVPQCIGQMCHDTDNDNWYISHSVAAAGWKIMAGS